LKIGVTEGKKWSHATAMASIRRNRKYVEPKKKRKTEGRSCGRGLECSNEGGIIAARKERIGGKSRDIQ